MDKRLMVMTKQDVVVDVVDLNVVERHDVEEVVSDGRSSDVRVVRASCDFTIHGCIFQLRLRTFWC